MTTMPPSTLRLPSSVPVSAAMASTTSRVWNAVASSAARARWALVTDRVRPAMTPRASLRQYGAKRPEKAGTR